MAEKKHARKSPNNVAECVALFDSTLVKTDILSQKIGFNKAPSYPARSGTSATLQLRPLCVSPWEMYEKIYEVDLSGHVIVATRKASPSRVVHMRSFPTKEVIEKTLYLFRQLQHQNIVTALEAFTTDTGLYIVLEHMPLSLERIVKSLAYPNEEQLAAILGQIVSGVAYLEAEGFEHGTLSCSNILLNMVGDVKISNQESCHRLSESKASSRDIRAVSSITMELMQKYVKDNGAIGLDDLNHWPSNSNALGFLSATTSVVYATELLKHPLFHNQYQKESLVGLIMLAQDCTRGYCTYPLN